MNTRFQPPNNIKKSIFKKDKCLNKNQQDSPRRPHTSM
jgi:hypothetical protein